MDGVWYIFGGDIGKTYKSEIEAYDPKGKNVLFCILVRASKTYIAIITQNNLLLFLFSWRMENRRQLAFGNE